MVRVFITAIISATLSVYTAGLVSSAISAVPPIMLEAGTEAEVGIW